MTEWSGSHANKAARLGVSAALAILVGYLETLIPVFAGLPGMKLGLANIVTVFLLYRVGLKEAVLVSLVRIMVLGFLFGNLYSILYGICGACASIAVMYALKRVKLFSCVVVSMSGGVAHNIGQLVAAAFAVSAAAVFYYLPFLIISGMITGVIVGMLAKIIIRPAVNGF